MICARLTGYISRPEDAGLSDQDIVRTVETLHDYCVDEKFYYTAVNHKRPDRKAALRILSTLRNL